MTVNGGIDCGMMREIMMIGIMMMIMMMINNNGIIIIMVMMMIMMIIVMMMMMGKRLSGKVTMGEMKTKDYISDGGIHILSPFLLQSF